MLKLYYILYVMILIHFIFIILNIIFKNSFITNALDIHFLLNFKIVRFYILFNIFDIVVLILL